MGFSVCLFYGAGLMANVVAIVLLPRKSESLSESKICRMTSTGKRISYGILNIGLHSDFAIISSFY